MIEKIVRRHQEGNLEEGIPNPSLEEMCQLVSKAALAVTPKVQQRAFRNTGVTLAIDGSEDDQLTPFLKKLLQKHNQSLVVTKDDLKRFMSPAPTIQKSPMARIFEVLCGDAAEMKKEEFMYEQPSKKRKLDKQ